MIGEVIGKIMFSKLFSESFDFIKQFLKKENIKDIPTKNDIENSLTQNIQSIMNWSQDISFNDLKSRKPILKSYIPLDFFVTPRKQWMLSQESEKVKISHLLQVKENIILLGTPGSGKTTTMKFLCQKIFYDDKFFPEVYKFPIVIRLREFNNIKSANIEYPLISSILDIIGASTSLYKLSKHQKITMLSGYLNNFNCLLIIDGFDEIGNHDLAKSIIAELNELSLKLSYAKLIITSRTGEIPYGIQNTSVFELTGLNQKQIVEFITKWLKDKKRIKDFLAQISNSPFNDTLIRPITLAHLCALYERYNKIPDKPKSVYRKTINLLIEEWDEQRGIDRESQFKGFTIDRKYEFLTFFAYQLTIKFNFTVFKTEIIKEVFYLINESFNLPKTQFKNVLKEIESQNGIFLQSGYENFEFAHKSLQEFLAAEYLVKLSSIPKNTDELRILPNELAIAVTLSSNPSIYFSIIVQRFIDSNLKSSFISIFISRLLSEKPDFVINPLLGVGYLLLYEACIKAEIQTLEQSNTLDFLLQLFNLNAVKKSINKLENFYYISDFGLNSFSNFKREGKQKRYKSQEVRNEIYNEYENNFTDLDLEHSHYSELVVLERVHQIENDIELITPEYLISSSSFLKRWINK